jgi:hypothetical protein
MPREPYLSQESNFMLSDNTGHYPFDFSLFLRYTKKKQDQGGRQMGVVAITFNSYLQRLKDIEKAKPKKERRYIPSVRQITLSAGIAHTTGSRLMHGHVTAVSLSKLALIIDEMRGQGFSTEITDFLTYIPDDKLSEMS